MLLDLEIPHGHHGLLKGIASHQRRLGIAAFEILADRKYFADSRPVIEFKYRHRAVRIDFPKGIAELLALAQVDLYQRNINAFFRQENAHTLGAGCCRAIVQFHLVFPRLRNRFRRLTEQHLFGFLIR